ncbi:hypothetical protein QL285_010449 [Trifolium repens]|nr:hypothetical protein QL285_010449 [Trifolium repens]
MDLKVGCDLGGGGERLRWNDGGGRRLGVRWWRLVLGVGGGDVRGGDGSLLVVAWCVRARLFRRASPSTFVRSELLRRFIRSTFSVPSFAVQPSFVPIQLQIRSSSSTLEFQASDSFSDFNLQICSPKICQPSASIFKIQGGVTHNTLDDIHNHWKKVKL